MRILTLLLAAALSGCSAARPYTAGERVALTHAVIGQSLDVVTTDMALQDPQMSESNGLWWDAEDAGGMLAGKLVLIGIGCLIGEAYPDAREAIFHSIGGVGYAAAAWNTGVMIDNGVNPWEDSE